MHEKPNTGLPNSGCMKKLIYLLTIFFILGCEPKTPAIKQDIFIYEDTITYNEQEVLDKIYNATTMEDLFP